MTGDNSTSSQRRVDVPGRIAEVRDAIGAHVRRTPTLDVDLTRVDGTSVPVTLKCEYMQVAGSFKARGAFANLLLRDVPEAGVVAASGGNHGVAVAYAADRLGLPAAIFVPTISAPEKIDRIRALGADLVVAGDRYADALDAALRHEKRSGAMPVHAFDQPETILGQATVGAELLEQVPDLDTVLVAVGGGGLIAGIAAMIGDRVRVVGVEPELAPTLSLALKAGRPVDAPAGGVAADALAPRRVGEHVYPIVERSVYRVLLVGDDDIIAARDALWAQARSLVEPASAVAAAAVLCGVYEPSPGERVAIVLSGANLAPTLTPLAP